MKTSSYSMRRIYILLALAILPLQALPAKAASFKKLVHEGYKTSRLTTHPSGLKGWILSKEKERFFCKMNVSKFNNGKNKMGIFTSSGRMISMDKKAYEARNGGPETGLPQLKDLKAGRPRPQDVGSCIPGQ